MSESRSMADNKEKTVTREEIIGIVQLVIIFAAILVGREIGDLYSSYNEVSKLAVNLNFSEENIAAYLQNAMQGKNKTLNIGLAITISGYNGTEGQVTQTPDYIRKWLISVTLSPIVVQQPQVSDINLNFYVEGEQVLSRTYPFPKQNVGYNNFLNRSLDLKVDDEATLRDLISRAAAEHSGEVEVTISGRVKTNILFLESTLPFTTTRYPIVSAPSLRLLSETWQNPGGANITTSKVGETPFITLKLRNLTRVHSLTQNVTCVVYKEGVTEPVFTKVKTVTAAPSTDATYVFIFAPETPGVYYFSLDSNGFQVPVSLSPRLSIEP
jgi:hypothetical protein